MPETTATVIERDVFAWVKKPNARGHLEKIKEYRGKETVRSAYCKTHHKHSKTYAGSNEIGWVFFLSRRKANGSR